MADFLKVLSNYNPPQSGPFKDRPDLAAGVVDVLAYTMGDERLQYALEMRKAGWKGDLWMYMLQHGVRDADKQAEKPIGTAPLPDDGSPWRNNFGYKGSKDIVRLRDAGAFLKTNDGKTIYKNEDRTFAVVDTSHEEWRKLVGERIKELAAKVGQHYEGLWLDDLNIKFYLYEVGDTVTAKWGPADSQGYYLALLNYLEWMRKESAKVGWRFGGNLQGVYGDRWRALADELIKDEGHGPGVVMIEYAWLKHTGEWPSVWEWQQTFDKANHVIGNKGEIWFVIPVKGDEAAKGGDAYKRAEFGYHSSLLLADGKAAVRIGRNYAYQGDYAFFRDGDKLGDSDGLTRIEGDVYRREYDNGTVWVNPKARTSGIDWISQPEQPEEPEIPEVPEQPEEPEIPETPEVPETPTPEPIRPVIYLDGTVGNVPVKLAIGFDTEAVRTLLPILQQITGILKSGYTEVAP